MSTSPTPAVIAATTPAATATTLLFVPGDRPERFDKALASGADLVVLDLEDAVAPPAKDAARGHVVDRLRDGSPGAGGAFAVRVEAGSADDVEALAGLADGSAGPAASAGGFAVMVPKAEDPDALAEVAGRLGREVLALVETAGGVLAAPALARVPGVRRLVLGTYDLAAQLGVDPDDRTAMAGARHALVLASAAAGLAPPVDGVTGAVTDDDALRADLAHAVRLGFGAKLCVHPRQVPLAAAAFTPTDEQVAWARRVAAAAAGAGQAGAVLLDGAMVDKPVVDRARRLLARAGDAG